MARAVDRNATGEDIQTQSGAPAVVPATPPSARIDRPGDMGEVEDGRHVRHPSTPNLRPAVTTRG